MPTRTCLSCRNWQPPTGGPVDCTGLCRNPKLGAGPSAWQRTAAGHGCDDWSEMAYYRGNDGAMHIDRRMSARTSTDYPARLQTTGGDWSGRLTDISENGARLQVSDPPRTGVHALLRCGANEIFCKIAWATNDSCGLSFDRPISSNLLFEVGGKVVEPVQTVADVSKIPVGKKREGLQPVEFGEDCPDSRDEESVADEKVVLLDERRPDPVTADSVASSFESRDEEGYIKFYPFRAMANP